MGIWDSILGRSRPKQADLDSLEGQQAFLRDQTSMSTVVVNIERTPADLCSLGRPAQSASLRDRAAVAAELSVWDRPAARR